MEPHDLLAERYELLAPLGSGGMARVFEAHDRVLNRRVAVKVLSQHLSDDPAALERFRREIQVAASLTHPNVVAVHDGGQVDGMPFLVMERLDGGSLADRLRRSGPLAVEEALSVAVQVAAGLDVAHARGLVHRDIKPANVLFTADGTAKISDFGIAQATDATATSNVHGSLPYAAPEQLQGGAVDVRTDLYGLGCVLYEALTGTPAFQGDTPAATIAAHLHVTPAPPSTLAPQLPPVVDAIVARALARDPAQRFADMGAFATALTDAMLGDDATRPLPPVSTDTLVGPAVLAPGMAPGALAAAHSGHPGDGDSPHAHPSDAPGAPTGRRKLWMVGAGLIVLLLAALVAAGLASSDPSAARLTAGTPSTAATPSPASTPSPTARPSPTPSPTPTPTPPRTASEAAVEVRAAIAEGRASGELSAKAVEELEKRLGDVLDEVEDDEPGDALEKLADLRDKLWSLSEKGDVTAARADVIESRLRWLAATL